MLRYWCSNENCCLLGRTGEGNVVRHGFLRLGDGAGHRSVPFHRLRQDLYLNERLPLDP
jgi:hypothetical protein